MIKKLLGIFLVAGIFILTSVLFSYASGCGKLVYNIKDGHTGEDLSNNGVAVYARVHGTRDWRYIGVYVQDYGNSGTINYTTGQSEPCQDNNHFIFPGTEIAPNLDIKFVCEGYKPLVVNNQSLVGIYKYALHR